MSERRDYGVCHNVGTLLIYRQDGRGGKTFVAVPCSDGVWDCSYQLPILPREKEVIIMDWEIPSFVEVKMDSEINSYQDDFKDKDLSEAQEPPPEAVISTDHHKRLPV